MSPIKQGKFKLEPAFVNETFFIELLRRQIAQRLMGIIGVVVMNGINRMGFTHLTHCGQCATFIAEVKRDLVKEVCKMLVELDSRKRVPLGRLLKIKGYHLVFSTLK